MPTSSNILNFFLNFFERKLRSLSPSFKRVACRFPENKEEMVTTNVGVFPLLGECMSLVNLALQAAA